MKIQISLSAASKFPEVDEALVKCATLISDCVQNNKGSTTTVLTKYRSFLKGPFSKALSGVIGDKAVFSDDDEDADGMSDGSHDIYGSVVYTFKKAGLKIILDTDLDGNYEGTVAITADVLPLDGGVPYGVAEVHTAITVRPTPAGAASKLLVNIGALVKKIGTPAFMKEYAEKVSKAEKSERRKLKQVADAPEKSKEAIRAITTALTSAHIGWKMAKMPTGETGCRVKLNKGSVVLEPQSFPPYVCMSTVVGRDKSYISKVKTVDAIIKAIKKLVAQGS